MLNNIIDSSKSDFKPVYLTLANGREFVGLAPSYQNEIVAGELVFNTGMTGYEETLTDPSYAGQILNFTYPILGNYGIALNTFFESAKIHPVAIICEGIYDFITPESTKSFKTWLQEQNIPLIIALDSRALTIELTNSNSINAVISYQPLAKQYKLQYFKSLTINWVAQVSCAECSEIGIGTYKIILVDCGVKENIIRCLLKFDLKIKRVPYDYDYSNEFYDGIILSNGPGDPQLCSKTINILTRALLKAKPIFGICLGAQLLALAIKARTYKLKFAHRGHNQPVIDLKRNLCYLTAQNHAYAIDESTIPDDWIVNFKHLNDHSVAGIEHQFLPFSAVQFHPEAAAGPHDTFYLFENFMEQLRLQPKL